MIRGCSHHGRPMSRRRSSSPPLKASSMLILYKCQAVDNKQKKVRDWMRGRKVTDISRGQFVNTTLKYQCKKDILKSSLLHDTFYLNHLLVSWYQLGITSSLPASSKKRSLYFPLPKVICKSCTHWKRLLFNYKCTHLIQQNHKSGWTTVWRYMPLYKNMWVSFSKKQNKKIAF